MSPLLAVAIVVAALFLVGQWYLHTRRRKASRLFERLTRQLGVAGKGTRIDLLVSSHRVSLDAQISRDDRPEELRLTLWSKLPGDLRLTRLRAAAHYDDCKHREPAALGAPFAGWHVRSEDPALLVALASERRVHESLEALAVLGFARVELAGTRLRAVWPDFSWEPDDHRWDAGDADALPSRVRRAAARLSELATIAEGALRSSGFALRGSRVRATLSALLVFPLLLMAAAIPALVYLYDAHPTLRDGPLLAAMVLAGTALAAIYTGLAYALLRNSIQRGARAAVVGFVSLLGFCLASSAPILWWNGGGPQGPGQRVTVEVVKLDQVSALASGRGWLLRQLIGEDSPIEEWATTRRAIVRSWRDDSRYALTLSAEQFSTVPPDGGRLSFTVFPGALGLEWYSDVIVLDEEGGDRLRPEGDDARREVRRRRPSSGTTKS